MFFEEKIEFFVIKPKFSRISEIFVKKKNQNYCKIKELFSNYNIDRKNKNTKPYDKILNKSCPVNLSQICM